MLVLYPGAAPATNSPELLKFLDLACQQVHVLINVQLLYPLGVPGELHEQAAKAHINLRQHSAAQHAGFRRCLPVAAMHAVAQRAAQAPLPVALLSLCALLCASASAPTAASPPGLLCGPFRPHTPHPPNCQGLPCAPPCGHGTSANKCKLFYRGSQRWRPLKHCCAKAAAADGRDHLNHPAQPQ
jgi:hypothetical protein